jgi:hypothetical protein
MLGHRGGIGVRDLLAIPTNGKKGVYANINEVRVIL